MSPEDFIREHLQEDKSYYEKDEVEFLIRQAWIACVASIRGTIFTQKLIIDAQMDQASAAYRDWQIGDDFIGKVGFKDDQPHEDL